MGAEAKDVATLARKLRAKGQNDAQVTEALQGLGFTKSQAAQAVADTAPAPAPASAPAPAAKKKTSGGGSKTAGATPTTEPPPAAPATPGITMPELKAPDLSGLTLTPPRKLSGGDLGGFLGGLFVYALVLNFIRYGKAGPTAWLSAKFLNRPDPTLKPLKPSPRSSSNKPPPAVTPAATSYVTGLISTRPAPPDAI